MSDPHGLSSEQLAEATAWVSEQRQEQESNTNDQKD